MVNNNENINLAFLLSVDNFTTRRLVTSRPIDRFAAIIWQHTVLHGHVHDSVGNRRQACTAPSCPVTVNTCSSGTCRTLIIVDITGLHGHSWRHRFLRSTLCSCICELFENFVRSLNRTGIRSKFCTVKQSC